MTIKALTVLVFILLVGLLAAHVKIVQLEQKVDLLYADNAMRIYNVIKMIDNVARDAK